jgi:hypothetical protein
LFRFPAGTSHLGFETSLDERILVRNISLCGTGFAQHRANTASNEARQEGGRAMSIVSKQQQQRDERSLTLFLVILNLVLITVLIAVG